MKNLKWTLVSALIGIAGSVFAQTDPKADSLNSNPNYDEALAEKLGADDYGMKSYFFVVL